ncbi:MAG: succinate dehydrogenase hydrophobic membrane anchor subunit [Actinomycetota bacterium]
MAPAGTGTETGSGRREPKGGFHRAGRRRPGSGAELWWWLFMRLSGAILVFLAVGHILIMHVFDEGVDRVNFAFVQLRWQSPFWRTWDWLMLSLALVHGINGVRVIALDYIRRSGVRIAVTWSFYVTGIALFALGSIVVFTFDPCRWPGFTC